MLMSQLIEAGVIEAEDESNFLATGSKGKQRFTVGLNTQ